VTASTDLVDRRGFHGFGASSTQGDLTSRRLSLVSLDDIAKVDLLDVVGLEAGLFESALESDDAELRGRDFGQRALERAYRRPCLDRRPRLRCNLFIE
jgi:hypothetical protein